MLTEDSKITVQMVCECGNMCELCDSYSQGGNRVKAAIVVYDTIVYICTECGKEMVRRINKTVRNTKITEVK